MRCPLCRRHTFFQLHGLPQRFHCGKCEHEFLMTDAAPEPLEKDAHVTVHHRPTMVDPIVQNGTTDSVIPWGR